MNFTDPAVLVANTTTSAQAFASDFFIVLVLLFVAFFFCFRAGRRGIIALTFALYVATALYHFFPYKEIVLGWGSAPLLAVALTAALFFGLVTIPYTILRRVIVTDFLGRGRMGFFFIISFLLVSMVLAIAYHVTPIRDFYAFTPAMDVLFAPEEYFFIWLGAPLLGLILLAR